MAFQWSFAKDTPAFLEETPYDKGAGKAVLILRYFNLLIGNWIIKRTCTFYGLVVSWSYKCWSPKITVFLVIVVINQVKVYTA